MQDAFGIDRTDISKGLPSPAKTYLKLRYRNMGDFSKPQVKKPKSRYINLKMESNKHGKIARDYGVPGIGEEHIARGKWWKDLRDQEYSSALPAPKTRPLRNI